MDQDETWHGLYKVGLYSGHTVLDGDPAPPSPKGAQPLLQFLAHVCCDRTAGWIKMPFGTKVGLSQGHIVLDGHPAPQKRAQPPFLAHLCCGQTAGWIKMPLGREVGLDPGNIVLDGWFRSPLKRGTAPNFWPMSIVAKRLDGSRCHWYEGWPQPRPHCVRWGWAPPIKGHTPNFRPMSVVAKRLDRSRFHLVQS